ncbi:MAG: YhbY family RNA-binding protein [Burkholderiaceae bacterium]|nr:YhbY family RNA-binding protein [Burkholderiaceae bacterium]
MDEYGAPVLTPAQRKALKARAHHLDPVVIIGEAGLTGAVLAEAALALRAHQLVKIRVHGDERAARAMLMDKLCAALGCAPVQSIGKLLVVYRPSDDEDNPSAKPGARERRGPHRPKKTLGAKAESAASARVGARGKKPPAGESAKRTPFKGGIKLSTASGKSLGARTSGKSPSAKTAGKRTDLSSSARLPARRGTTSKATQGPVRLQGGAGARTAGRRNRAKGGS